MDLVVTAASANRRARKWRAAAVAGLASCAAAAAVVVVPDAALLPLLQPALAPLLALGAAVGLLSGFLFGLLGIGGALVVVPALYVILPALGVAAADVPHAAVATSLAVMLPIALRGTWVQHRRGGIDAAWLARLLPGVLVGAIGGAALAMQLSGPVVSLLFVAQSLYYGWGLMRARPPAESSVRARLSRGAKALPAWTVGPLAGGFCACAGMGGGSLLVPYLIAHGVAVQRAAATSGAFNLGIAAGGVLALLGMQAVPGGGAEVCIPAAVVIGCAGLLAVPFGVGAGLRLPALVFRRALGSVNLFGASALLLRTVWI